MKKIVSALLLIVCGLLPGSMVHGSQETERMANSYDINGYSIAYYENNKIVFENYGAGINEKSVFELASNGKVISAYIALQLVDEGKLNLEDKIAPFLDDSLLTDDKRIYDITKKNCYVIRQAFLRLLNWGLIRKYIQIPVMSFVIQVLDIFIYKM